MSFHGRLIAPYQHDGVQWMVNREKESVPGGFLCDEMGLGKTVQTIATMCINKRPKTLIIAPKSIITQWKDEIRRFTRRTMSVFVWEGPNRTRDPSHFDNYDVVITSYSLIIPRAGENATPLHRIKWNRIVFDEAHEIRTPTSKTYRYAFALESRIRWLITGTPVFNSSRDFVTLGRLLKINQFALQYSAPKIIKTLGLRRTKSELAEFNERLRLPPCEFEVVELEMYENEKTLYDVVYERAKDDFMEALMTPGSTMEILECFLRVRQVMVWPQMYLNGIARKDKREPDMFQGSTKKMDTLTELINSHPKEKAIIFCQFREEMDEIQRRMEVPVFRLDGSVSHDQRSQRIEEFKQMNGGAVFIIQIKAGGVGLNLQEATRVYITSPSWNPATELQAIARAHRTGQTQKVYVKKLIYACDNSVEQSIMQLQNHKSLVCAEVLNDPRLESQLPKGSDRYSIKDLKKLFTA